MAKNVGHILQDKGSETWCVVPDASVYEALEIMADKNVGALVVVEHGRIVGILSERDYARKVILAGFGSKEMSVAEIMTPDPVTVGPDASVTECMELMTDNRFRHLPVVVDGELVGVISIGDVVLAVIAEQRFLIAQLESYITG
jgi:CBS domain-containing protein